MSEPLKHFPYLKRHLEAHRNGEGISLSSQEVDYLIHLIDAASSPVLAALVEALEYTRDIIQQLPGGIDEETQEDDTCPEDATQHIGGLILKRVIAALEAARKETEK